MSFCFKFRPRVQSVAIGLFLVANTGISASAQTCGCLVPVSSVPAGQAIGQFNSISGQVNVLGKGGWVSAANGGSLFADSKVETGPGSSTSISIGKCSLNVAAQSTVSITPTDQALCVAVANTAPAVNNTALIAVGVGLAAVGGVLAVSTGDDKPASP